MLRWRGPFLLFALLAGLLAGSDLAFGSCIVFPRDAEEPVVEVCDENDTYSFRLADTTRSFDKDEFAARIISAAREWLNEHGDGIALLDGGLVEVWMTVPMANPEAGQPRAIVETSHGLLSFWFDLHALEWKFSHKEAAVLTSGSYPQTFGHRPASVFVQSQNDASPQDVTLALRARGALDVIERGSGLFEARTRIFDEKKFATHVGMLTSVIKYAQVNSVMEWIADRQMAFSFVISRAE